MAYRRARKPCDMCDYMGVGEVESVPVRAPVRWMEVHFHVTREMAAIRTHLQYRMLEIRPRLHVPCSGIDYLDRRAVNGTQALWPECAVVPQRLDVPLRERLAKGVLDQTHANVSWQIL